MTGAAALLATARGLGVRVERNGARLRVVAPPEVASEEWSGLVNGLAALKPEVLALLDAEQPPPVEIPDFPARKPWRLAVATWTIEFRQRWADRTAELQDAGYGWREAEAKAFDDLRGKARRIPGGSGPVQVEEVEPAFLTDDTLAITTERVAEILAEDWRPTDRARGRGGRS